ncbi:MAG: AAA family ATPase [Actinomycetota bacterium]|nr:AAA family ATPase [Actinomycetota bacterium]
MLWGDAAPAAPRNAVQTYVARLRGTLGEHAGLLTRSPGYLLQVGSAQVDALRFDQLLDEAERRNDQPDVARDLLDEALKLWRGPAYAGFDEGLARAEALRLAERRLVALEERAAARMALGEAIGVIGELEALVHTDPLRERFVDLLMRALASVDRRADALAVHRRYRERLAAESGLEPSPSMQRLEGAILRGEIASSRPPTPTRPEPRGPGSTVPVMTSSVVGRETEIAAVRNALRERRLVTLTGTGGVGKTRIAAEVAASVDRDEPDDVAWANLAPLADPAAVDHVVANTIGADLAGTRAPRDALLGALTTRTLLLVLDNCEHLLDTVAALTEQIQRDCADVTVLATSRERLAVPGEQVLPVPPLPVGADTAARDGGDAVRLFIDRATAAAPGLDLTAERSAVAEICRQLDGLPLAIELAAARMGALSAGDLLAVLREDIAAPVGRRRGRDARHRDLCSVVDWSYRLLDEAEQRLFERLSVFAGAFGVDEVHAVCAPDDQHRSGTVEQLAALAERSMLDGPMTGPSGGSGRYRMLRTLRRFARDRLLARGEADAIAARHVAVLTARAEQAAGPPMSEQGRRWLETSLDDLREAARRARHTDNVDVLARLVAALYRFDYWRPGGELLGWAADALAMDGIDDHPAAPQVHAAAAAAAWIRGDLERAGRLAARGTELGVGPDDPACIFAFEALGDVANFTGRLDESETAFREVVRLARIAGDPDSVVMGQASTAVVFSYAGRIAEAIEEADAAARAAEDAGPAAQAFARYIKGECRTETAPDEALALVEEAARLARDCGAWFIDGVAQLTAASLRVRHDEPTQALPAFADLIRRWRRSGSWTQQWTTLRNLVELLVHLEADEPAVIIAAAAEVAETAAPTFGAESDRLRQALVTANERLGDGAFAAARQRGQALPDGEVIEVALRAADELQNSWAKHPPRRSSTDHVAGGAIC